MLLYVKIVSQNNTFFLIVTNTYIIVITKLNLFHHLTIIIIYIYIIIYFNIFLQLWSVSLPQIRNCGKKLDFSMYILFIRILNHALGLGTYNMLLVSLFPFQITSFYYKTLHISSFIYSNYNLISHYDLKMN